MDQNRKLFKLSDKFFAHYDGKQPNWGYGDLSYFTYRRTYSRLKEDGTNEEYCDTIRRVVEGCFQIQLDHCVKLGLPWDGQKAQRSAQKMFEKMWEFKFTAPGRGLWVMGTPVVDKLGSAALNNCGYISTKDIKKDFGFPFSWACDMLMLGVGVGFDTKGAGTVTISKPKGSPVVYQIPDTREGWVESVKLLLNSYTGQNPVTFDYSLIRPAGSPIKGFGGTSSGPGPLKEGHDNIRQLLDKNDGEAISSTVIVDIMNFIGKFVVAGNVRRSAELAIGEPNDTDYISMKDPSKYGNELIDRRWASNNSVYADSIQDYSSIVELIAKNGEPGLIYIENSRAYGRVKDGKHEEGDPEYDDVSGYNPCAEQSLAHGEMCCLVETYPANHSSAEEFIDTLKYAYLYAKSVTLLPTHDPLANSVMLRNRRIGLSQSGVQQAIKKFGHSTYFSIFCDEAYNIVRRWDLIYSRWLGVPTSIKVTTVKPSGCQRKETLVNTTSGILRLEELGNIAGSPWQSISNKSTTNSFGDISKFYINGRTKTKAITTEDGNLLECSYNHRYRVYKDGSIVWKRADELVIGDNLVCVLGDYNSQAEETLQQCDPPYHNCNKIKMPICMSPSLAWLLGLIYGDGSVHDKGIRISFNRKETSLTEVISSVVSNLFDIDVKIDNDHSIYLNSTHLVKWLRVNGLLKEFCEELRFPKAIRCSSKESILSFINGLWRADGGIHNSSNNWTICTISYQMAIDLLSVGRAIGLNLSLKNAGPGGWGSKDRWIVSYRSLSSRCTNELKNRKIDDKHWLDPISKIEDSECETFDIEVPDTNEYISNGVRSHNTVSLLAGATPGVHCTHSEYYFRTIRVSAGDPMVPTLLRSNYRVEVSVTDSRKTKEKLATLENLKELVEANVTLVVYFAIKEANYTKSKYDISLWEQMSVVRELQNLWSDNSVSCTITFKPDEVKDLESAIKFIAPYVKTLSFLPLDNHQYLQAPYQTITEEQYNDYIKQTKPLKLSKVKSKDILGDKYCSNDTCII